jgi:hypothetical protein
LSALEYLRQRCIADDAEQDEAAAKSGTGELLAHCRCDVARDATAYFNHCPGPRHTITNSIIA